MIVQQGKVSTQARIISQMLFLFIFTGYADKPAPIIEAVAVCVVLTGIPPRDAASIHITAEISAARPLACVRETVSIPTFFMIL